MIFRSRSASETLVEVHYRPSFFCFYLIVVLVFTFLQLQHWWMCRVFFSTFCILYFLVECSVFALYVYTQHPVSSDPLIFETSHFSPQHSNLFRPQLLVSSPAPSPWLTSNFVVVIMAVNRILACPTRKAGVCADKSSFITPIGCWMARIVCLYHSERTALAQRTIGEFVCERLK